MAAGMEGTGNQLLAGAALSRDQHIAGGAGNLFDNLEDFLHIFSLADDPHLAKFETHSSKCAPRACVEPAGG